MRMAARAITQVAAVEIGCLCLIWWITIINYNLKADGLGRRI
jgi:hypothetical protein